MSLVNDIQCKLAIKSLADMTIAVGESVSVSGAVIDTKEYQAMTVSLEMDRALTASDILTYKFEQSLDGSTNWNDVPTDGHLPNRKNPERTIEIAQNGQLQDVGCFSSDRYVRLVVEGTNGGAEIALSPTVVLESMVMEDAGYSSEKLPNDGQP